ncbi:hypothetical protein PVAND_003657 [Polypedilum vanderplanki]|uniref:Uncharacterized protein n=1 Tax=Polypedilum vanderplanki TaxID=319348 RepID=A0A9J6BUQ9_POLVA|nr:hypothetical protein PVAND_003657 [Polypedilum vanderplanki]
MYDTVMEFDTDFYDHSSRFEFEISEDTSFFTTRSPPSSPRPCPISPSHDSSSLLPMDEDCIDLSSFINKENKKPFSPARKRLNMDALATKSVLQSNNFTNIITTSDLPFRYNNFGLKRSDSTFESPVQSKRYKSENHPPASPTTFSSLSSSNSSSNQPAIKKTISIMNALTSSSENLRKNRL